MSSFTDENSFDDLLERLSPANRYGRREPSRENLETIFKYHPALRGLLAFDEFSQRAVLTRSPAWRKLNGDNNMRDIDDVHIRGICETFGIIGKDGIYDATQREIAAHTFHPVRDYLKSLAWDGAPRMATALNDSFSAANRRTIPAQYQNCSLKPPLCVSFAPRANTITHSPSKGRRVAARVRFF